MTTIGIMAVLLHGYGKNAAVTRLDQERIGIERDGRCTDRAAVGREARGERAIFPREQMHVAFVIADDRDLVVRDVGAAMVRVHADGARHVAGPHRGAALGIETGDTALKGYGAHA